MKSECWSLVLFVKNWIKSSWLISSTFAFKTASQRVLNHLYSKGWSVTIKLFLIMRSQSVSRWLSLRLWLPAATKLPINCMRSLMWSEWMKRSKDACSPNYSISSGVILHICFCTLAIYCLKSAKMFSRMEKLFSAKSMHSFLVYAVLSNSPTTALLSTN